MEKEKYSFFKYDSQSRWVSYWHQINEVLSLKPKNVLEIGVGNKTVTNYLKNQEIEVITIDINEELKPDVVGNVLKMPFRDGSFDVVLCAEVLEHLHFENFEKALLELKRVTRKYIVLSLPHFGPVIKFSFKIPFLKEKKLSFKIPLPLKHKFDGEHYWEIGKRGYALGKIKKILGKYFQIKKDFVPFEMQYHHFFILEKDD